MLDVSLQGPLGAQSFDIKCCVLPGISAVIGPSGAGKTTLLRAISGLWHPLDVKIKLNNHVLSCSKTRVHVSPHLRGIGYVFQEPRLFLHMNVLQNIRYAQKGIGGSYEERLISLLGLEPLLKRKPYRLSGGEQQRVALARSLMARPKLLLCDEPLAALDAARKEAILPFLAQLRDELDIPVVYVSHAMSEVMSIADELIVMQEGQVVLQGGLEPLSQTGKLRPYMPRDDLGSVLVGRICERDITRGVSFASVGGQRIAISDKAGELGQSVRIKISAYGIILAAQAPEMVSALNVLAVQIAHLEAIPQSSLVVAHLRLGDTALWTVLTHHSAQMLRLEVGKPCVAIFKASAVFAL